jgi:hypothetical protein
MTTAEPEFAISGWLVEVVLMPVSQWSDRRFFAVGAQNAAEATESVLRYPGIVRTDRRSARRPLSAAELSNLSLRWEAVRPYQWSPEASRDA